MKKILLLFLLIIFSSCSSQETIEKEVIEENKKNPIKIVAFGDSLTAGYGLNESDAYPAQLEEYLIQKNFNVKIFNSGLSGETSSAALSRVDWVLQINPQIVILATGANDAFRGIDLSLTRSNIEGIIDTLNKNNVTVILMGLEIVENLGEEYVQEFEGMFPQIAQEKEVIFIPKFLEGVGGVDEFNQNDRIHPTKEGYSIIVKNNIGPKIEEVLKN